MTDIIKILHVFSLAGMDSRYCGWGSILQFVSGTQATPRCADTAGTKGPSVTVETVIRERESIIHGKGRLMYHRD